MRDYRHFIGAICVAFGVGCGNYSGGNQVSAEKNESGEQPNFGSATDIVSDQRRSTNDVNSADVGIGGPVQRASGNYQSQPLPGQASDEELAKKVKVALTTGSMGTTGVIAEDQLTTIDVSVQNGVVTLRGPVASEQEKETLGKQVSGMKGVNSVRNELTIGRRSGSPAATDPLVPRTPGNE
jgi:hypothetical protein